MKPLKIFPQVTVTAILLAMVTFSVFGTVNNSNTPSKGEWEFKLEKVWEISHADELLLAFPDQLMVSDDETLYVKDDKEKIIHIFNKEGKYIKSFGEKGEGPGELKHHLQLYPADDKIVGADVDRLHYFTRDGVYIRSVNNFFFRHRVEFFLNENEFITFPLGPRDMPVGGVGKITRYNLTTSSETPLAEFSVFSGGTSGRESIIKEGLTPMMVLGREPGGKRFYYGVNDAYAINIMDMKGKALDSFSVKRNKLKVSEKSKEHLFASQKKYMPPEKLKQIMNSTPDVSTYFYRIEVIGGMVYVFVPDVNTGSHPSQIDIFTPRGKYLYKAHIRPGKQLTHIFSPFHNLIFKNNHLYMVIENENNEIKVVKYKVSLPTL